MIAEVTQAGTGIPEQRPLPQPSFLRALWNRIGWSTATIVEFLLILAVWEAAVVKFGWVKAAYLAPPSEIVATFGQMLRTGYLQENITFSIQNFVTGFLVSAAVGLPAGLLMGMIPILNRALSPFLWAFYSTPRIALQPMIVIWLGFGWESKVLIIFLSAVFPILVNAMAGVQTVDQSLIRAGRVFGARRTQLYTKVILPSTLPFVLTGLRMGISRGLIGMVLGEMFGSSSGLGHIVARASAVFDVATALSGTVMVIIMANIAMTLFRYAEVKLVPWRNELHR